MDWLFRIKLVPMSASPPPDAASATHAWHTLPGPEVARLLEVDPTTGLSATDAERRRQRFGKNLLEHARGRSPWSILLAQFASLMVGLLVAATCVAFLMGEYVEAAAILVVVVLNGTIGFLTEWKAERTLVALEKQTVPTAHVLRDGIPKLIPAAELVPGDVVLVTAGDRIAADGRLLEVVRLQVEEAALTGESVAAEKDCEPTGNASTPLGDRHSMVYLGTAVTNGRGRFVVTETGARTEMGRIGKLIDEAGTRESPLDRKLSQLGRALVVIVLALCAVIVIAGWLRGNSFLKMLEVGISLAIAAVPEGLPAVATMTLALGMQRMARMRAIVRRLSAVETLGSTTIICTDKTGTLTRNEMTVCVYQTLARRVEVGGAGYEIRGDFQGDGQKIDPLADVVLRRALEIGALCNDSKLSPGPPATILGDPTEGALVVAAEKAGLRHGDLQKQFSRMAEVPFSSHAQRMITVHRTPEGKAIACVKGAPGALLALCGRQLNAAGTRPLGEADLKRIRALNDELAGRALRVLALAYREISEPFDEAEHSRDLIFVALVGMLDPLREEAKNAVAVCREAGIRVVMITGDQPATAREIGRQLGLDGNPGSATLEAVHGRDLANLDESGWQQIVAETAVFARVSPEHKLRIVESLQTQGAIVAMTGDGVNDAPALKKADIGIAMGIKGTEVAKEASAMIITDDNFATIVGAVEQGRVIYSNIIRFIHYLFSCNFSEIITVFVPIIVGWPLPLVALQILWLNMITDVFPALALALEPTTPGLMKRGPRDPKRPLLNAPFLWMITWQAALISTSTLAAFYVAMQWHGVDDQGITHTTTVAFMTLALAQVFHVFSCRSQRRSAVLSALFANAWLWGAVVLCIALQLAAVYFAPLNRVLHTTPLAGRDWLLVAACSLGPAVVIEAIKFVRHLIFGDEL